MAKLLKAIVVFLPKNDLWNKSDKYVSHLFLPPSLLHTCTCRDSPQSVPVSWNKYKLKINFGEELVSCLSFIQRSHSTMHWCDLCTYGYSTTLSIFLFFKNLRMFCEVWNLHGDPFVCLFYGLKVTFYPNWEIAYGPFFLKEVMPITVVFFLTISESVSGSQSLLNQIIMQHFRQMSTAFTAICDFYS